MTEIYNLPFIDLTKTESAKHYRSGKRFAFEVKRKDGTWFRNFYDKTQSDHVWKLYCKHCDMEGIEECCIILIQKSGFLRHWTKYFVKPAESNQLKFDFEVLP